jgi:hypothetical protein
LARVDNNVWTDPGIASLNILFCAFNHSCEPNVEWHIDPSNGRCPTVRLTAKRDIEAGEQLFVIYDQYLGTASLMDRRAALRRWLDADCRCVRCAWEEAALAVAPNEDSCTDKFDSRATDPRLLEARVTHCNQGTQITSPTEVRTGDHDEVSW